MSFQVGGVVAVVQPIPKHRVCLLQSVGAASGTCRPGGSQSAGASLCVCENALCMAGVGFVFELPECLQTVCTVPQWRCMHFERPDVWWRCRVRTVAQQVCSVAHIPMHLWELTQCCYMQQGQALHCHVEAVQWHSPVRVGGREGGREARHMREHVSRAKPRLVVILPCKSQR